MRTVLGSKKSKKLNKKALELMYLFSKHSKYFKLAKISKRNISSDEKGNRFYNINGYLIRINLYSRLSSEEKKEEREKRIEEAQYMLKNKYGYSAYR